MKYFLLILILFVAICGYGQEKPCGFDRNSIVMVDSLTSIRLLDTIRNSSLNAYNRKEKMPLFIQEAFDCWVKEWGIANPGRPYYATDAIGWRSLPRRQLMYLGLTDHYMLISYKHGGLAFNCPMLLFKFENEKILSVWYWVGFNEEIKTKEDILKYYNCQYPDDWKTETPNL